MLSPNVKLSPPRRQPRTLRRVRLLDTLHDNVHRKVLFVCAPAGYGKTTLLVDFADDVDAVVYWYRIAAEDNNLATFYENILQSFKLHHPEFGNHLSLSLEEGMPSPQELAYRLVNQLEETLQDFSVLVLDDYHLVSIESDIVDFVEAFINYLPDHLRVLIGSRNVYGIPTALLYVQEQLAIISEEDLKFRQEEIVELCWKYYHIQLSEAESQAVLNQAEGWIVAILLALRSENLAIEIPKILGAREHVYAYLAEEVIQTLPPSLIEFLYATSLVDEFTVPLANHVLGIENAQEVIKQLDELNLFLSSSSDTHTETSYRYHQLFSEFLQGNLKATHPGVLPDIHARIADWYQQQGQMVPAITHYFQAGEKETAVRLVDQVSREMYLSGQTRSLELWYDQLADDPALLGDAPDLLLNLAKYKTNQGEFERAEKLLDKAEKTLIEREDYTNHVNLQVTRGTMYRFTGRYQEAIELAEEVQAEVEEFNLDRYYWFQAERLRGMAAYFLGDAERALECLKLAARALREMVEEVFLPRQAHELIVTLADIGFVAIAAGNIFEAQKSYREALDLARRLRTNFNDLTLAYNNYGYLNFLMGNYAEAWKLYLQGYEVAKFNNVNRSIPYLYNGQADVLREIGEWKQAESVYQNARQQAEKLDELPALADAYAGLVEVEAKRQEFNTAMYYVRELARVQQEDIHQPVYQQRLARIYLEMGQLDLARDLLEKILKESPEQDTPRASQDEVNLYLYYARLLVEADEKDAALDQIKTALKLTAMLGYDQFVVNLLRNHLETFSPLFMRMDSAQAKSLLARARKPLPTLEQLVSDPHEEEDESQVVLNVTGLDSGAIRLNGRILPQRAWSSVGARALFYFILDRKQVSKDEISLAFWPDFSQAKINSNFHATLWRVRKALGSKNIIIFRDGAYQFSPEAQIYFDVDEVESLFGQVDKLESPVERRTAMRRIVELYQTDYIEDIDMPWADERRFELQNQARSILGKLAEDYYDKRNYAMALEFYQKAVEFDPWQDEYHLKVMQSWYALGDKAAAREHYQRYAARLESEMGIPPDESLTQFLEEMG